MIFIDGKHLNLARVSIDNTWKNIFSIFIITLACSCWPLDCDQAHEYMDNDIV